MQFKSLQLFLDVVETGSFVSAAERRHTVQSNVTAHVKKLETELGARLFHRKGGARLTSAGRTVADYARRILHDHDEVLALFDGRKEGPSTLRLGAMETTTAVRLPPVLAKYHQSHPDVELRLETGPTAELIARLIDGGVDGVFVAGAPEHDRFHRIKAFTERLVLVGPEPLNALPSPEQLLENAFLAFRQGCSYRQRIELFLSSQGVTATRIFEFGSIDGILGCVAAGMGYALMPRATVEAYRQRFNVGILELPPAISELDTYFVTGAPDTWSPALKQFVSALTADESESLALQAP
ncbi:MAG: LysR family transcriptional regulator [Oceanospirillaceae bacterium]|jgi:DNA-binding transcriptional LysR family regulator|uniref:LysR family transcriptional regulator n=1 Tax=Marinobacterium litorale TaxID=404770 RepID=UPI00041394EA|nr:LysR family transcriptional regulator [Marinobacterium litorale]MBS97547.1 LysR family transcriptional regulator [Oceanospirillaceae bacterium]